MSNTLRATFAMIAGIILLGMMFSTGPSFILWLPVIGLIFAASTGNCPAMKVAGMVLDKMNIER